MHNAFIIARKELKSYLNSVSTYIVFVLFLMLSGWFFSNLMFKSGKAELRQLFDVLHLVYIFFIPALTMGMIAKEKADQTFELLATMPIKLKSIVWGKWLAALELLVIILMFTLVHLLTIMIIGENLDYGSILCGYLGLIFVGAVYCAIGIFASALQSNQILAFIIGFVICLFFYAIQFLMPLFPNALANVFQYLSMDYHLENFLKGIIDTRDIIYMGSLVIGFMLLAEFSLRMNNRLQER
ncbi:MAG TPA: ABC transporter permease subunit [Candidatus Cloacimonadota bacterium]|nr:ABC transporter permease subunit [Candidatus Cloacimonadota bacterium]HQL15536.1 ABC transporter permease subunit [Candidatus Cloacimonadota bacterium]